MDEEQAVTTLGRAVVSGIAAQELPLFDAISRAWFADPRRVRSGGSSDEALGFGVAEALPFVTPVVLAVASKVFALLAEDLGKALVHAAASEIAEQIRRLFRHEPSAIRLSPEQIARVRDVALIAAHAGNLSLDASEKLAEAVTAELAGTAKLG